MNDAFFSEMRKQAFGGTLGAMLAGQIGGSYALRETGDKKRAKKLREAMKKLRKDIEVTEKKDADPHYLLGKKKVVVRKHEDPSILAHELGHSDVEKDPIGKYVQNKLTAILGAGPTLHRIMMFRGFARGERGPGGIGTAIATAAAVPRSVYEGAASFKGVDLMREAGASEKEISDAKKRLFAAWSTYAADNLAPVGDWATLKYGPKALKALGA